MSLFLSLGNFGTANSETVGSQFLSLRQFLRAQLSPFGFPHDPSFAYEGVTMLTPFVMGIVFANCATAVSVLPYIGLTGALRTREDHKSCGAVVLTLGAAIPCVFAGCAGGAGRPFDIDGLNKEDGCVGPNGSRNGLLVKLGSGLSQARPLPVA